MKIVSLLLVFTFVSLSYFAQDFKKISDPTACRASILKKQKATKTLTADFKETIYSSMFNTPQKANGELNYKQTDKIRWEHTSPTKKVMLIDGSKIKYSENGVEIKDPSTKAVVKKIQNLMVKMLSGDFLDGKDFTIYYYESGSEFKLKLKPKSSRMSKYIESVVLIFNKSDLLLNEMSLIEDEDEKIVYSFNNVKSNSTISDSKFQSF
jgi:outer membrane lipoprotein carrier protein|tara:strand:- start:1132 stop:1758 length:627 start_codon:yes stop_codon:yes gene_type:complete